MRNQKSFRKDDVISASEIGQYTYCSISWYLHRCGYDSRTPMIEAGKKTHVDLGNTIDNIQYEIKRSKRFAVIGYLLLIFAIIIIIYGVM